MSDPIPAERRRSPRHATGFAAGLRERGWGGGAVRVVDLSLHGCRIGLLAPLPCDARVWIRLPGLDSLYARVVWCRGDQAGLEFEAPLHPLVLERLVASDGQRRPELPGPNTPFSIRLGVGATIRSSSP